MLDAARREDVDVVYATRSDRSSDTRFKRASAGAFYRMFLLLTGLPAKADAGDFRLMSRLVVETIGRLPDERQVLRFVVPSLGFRSTEVSYTREVRAAGESKYPLGKMLRLSLDSLVGFSLVPLRLAVLFGILGFIAAIAVLVYVLASLISGDVVAGWASTTLVVALSAGAQLLCLGILGEYLGRVYVLLLRRATYVVASDCLVEGSVVEVEAPGPEPPAPPERQPND